MGVMEKANFFPTDIESILSKINHQQKQIQQKRRSLDFPSSIYFSIFIVFTNFEFVSFQFWFRRMRGVSSCSGLALILVKLYMSRWLLGLSTSEEEHNQSKKLKFLDTRYVDKKFLSAIIFFSFSFLN